MGSRLMNPLSQTQSISTAACEAVSHRGLVRPRNQDMFLVRPKIGLFVVADGMGGLAHGERASQAVIDGLSGSPPASALDAWVAQCLTRVNDDLLWEAEMETAGMMGSTVVALLVGQGRFTCLWAGDSRAYRLRAGYLEQLTIDHTPIQEMIDAGVAETDLLAGDLTERASLAHLVTRAVGTERRFVPGRNCGRAELGDVFLLCTDGLTKTVADASIGALLAERDSHGAALRLVTAAIEAGGPDNVTALVARIGATSDAEYGAAADDTRFTPACDPREPR